MKRASVLLIATATLGLGKIPPSEQITPSETKAMKEWSYSLALQAATWGGPLVTMYALRHNDAIGPKARAAPNSIWRMENLSTPALSQEAGYVTPNVNVIYGFGFMDLRQEPIVIEAPNSEGRYYMVEVVDMWTNAFAYIGGKSTGYGGGKFALVGPDWEGDLPDGITRIDCPTPWVLVQPRVHIYVDGKIDLPGASKILNAIEPIGLSKFTGKPAPTAPHYNYPAPEPVSPNLPVSDLHYKDPLQFWTLLMEAMNENPPPEDQITALLPLFQKLGIKLGKRWDRSKLAPEVLEAMSEAAEKIGHMLANLPFATLYRGAFLPPSSIGNYGTDYATRAVVARVGLTANTPYEAIYWMYMMDENSAQLTGESRYSMTFKEALPCEPSGFWSITMYDVANNYTVPNPINRYMLGSDSPQIVKNSDGSFTIYIQQDRPSKEKEPNWLPAPKGPFYLIMRAYAPTPTAIDVLAHPDSWPFPAALPIK